MPSVTTHNIFAKEVFKKLKEKDQNVIKKSNSAYEMFSQSFDFFYFYNLLDFKNGKRYRKFGNYCHKSNTQLYLINIVDEIKKRKLEDNSDALAYLYGSINHYCLDSMCHPLVFYKTGTYNKHVPETKKYKSLHTRMEKQIDAYYYEKYYNKPFYKYNIVKEIIPKIDMPVDIVELMNSVYKRTYNKENMGVIYLKAYHDSRIIYRLSTYDRFGLKKLAYKLIDKLIPFKKLMFVNWSYYNRNIDTSYLNLEHKDWCHPCNIDEIKDDSFEDLFEKAIEMAINIIEEVNKVLDGKKELTELLEIIPNISYTTGKLITENKPMKYFEF